jgi:hypothetical protein
MATQPVGPQLPSKNVQMPDGAVIAFPGNLDDTTVFNEGQKYLGQKYGSTDPAVIQQKMQQSSKLDQLKAMLVKKGSFSKDEADRIFAPNQDPGKTLSAVGNVAADRLGNVVGDAKPFSIPAAISAGTTMAGMVPGGPIPKTIAGVGTAAATYVGLHGALDRAKRYLKGEPEGSDLPDAAEDLAINEVGSRAAGAAYRGIKAASPGMLGGLVGLLQKVPGLNFDPTSVMTDGQVDLTKLKPTLSAYLQSGDSSIAKGVAPIAKTVEDLFSPGSKAAALKESGAAAQQETTNLASQVSGRKNPTIASLGGQVQADFSNALDSTFKAADQQAKMAKLVAQGNPQQTMTGDVVNGPILPRGALEKANQIIQSHAGDFLGPQQEEIPLINQAKKLIDSTGAKFDPQTGQLLSANPVGFEDAWNQKQAWDDYGGWQKARGDVTHTDQQFRGMTAALNDDIDNSIAKWQNDPNKLAANAWKQSKAIVQERNSTFFTPGSSTKLGDVINDADSELPSLDAILNDPQKTQRALNSGNVKINGQQITSENTRRDLQGYKLIQMRDNAYTVDPQDPNKMVFNGQKLANQWSDPRFQQTKNILFNKTQQQDYSDLFKNIAITQDPQSKFGTYMNKIQVAKAGFMLAPAILAGYTSGMERGGEVLGLEVGMNALGRLMSNHDTARAFTAAVAGKPLEMSEQQFARKLVAGLQGTTLTLVSQGGKREQGQFDRDGQWVPQAAQ